MSVKLVIWLVQIALWLGLFGVGLFYLSSSIGGASVPYASLPRFLQSIGVCDAAGICDVASANGCFLCPYIRQLFMIIGTAAETLWGVIVGHTWILVAIGFALVMIWQAYEVIMGANAQNAAAPGSIGGERALGFPAWLDAIKDQLIRVLVVCALLGVAGYGGSKAMRAVSEAVIYPVMSVGTSLAMGAAGNSGCKNAERTDGESNPMDPVSDQFMCVIGNLNVAILSGASGGFALMNFASQGMGGGMMLWIGGLAVVFIFMFIGFNVLFQILNVVFNLVFLIIFLPLFIASYAFEKTWKMAGGVVGNAIGILIETAVRVVAVTLRVLILSSMVAYAQKETLSSDPAAEYAIIAKCEKEAADAEGRIDMQIYKRCFEAERAASPTAFGYLDRGWDFIVMVVFLFVIYFWLVDKKLGKHLKLDEGGVYFRFGDQLKNFGGSVWKLPSSLLKKFIPGGP
ncbi:MAG: hypothetical protein LBB08_02545 [Rickettsiales bacterium]|jgi:hypothetical protein|nr:hypothetical protein [Rickettsiales bacterium]